MLDVARHFMPVADVLRFVDLIAFHKLNVLHLHLTDDQGWRIEVPGWPRLTSVGAWRPRSMLGSSRARPLRRPAARRFLHRRRPARDRGVRGGPARHRGARDRPAGAHGGGHRGVPGTGQRLGPRGVRTAWGISPHAARTSRTRAALLPGRPGPGLRDLPQRADRGGRRRMPAGRVAGIPGGREFPRPGAGRRGRRCTGWYIAQIADHLRDARPPGVRLGRDPGRRRGRRAPPWRPGAARPRRPGRLAPVTTWCPARTRRSIWTTGSRPTRASRRRPAPLLTLDDVYAFEPVPPGLTAGEAARIIGAQANVWTEHMDSARAGRLHGVPAAVRLRRGGVGPRAPASPSGWRRTWPGWTRWASTTGRRPGRGRGTPGRRAGPAARTGRPGGRAGGDDHRRADRRGPAGRAGGRAPGVTT